MRCKNCGAENDDSRFICEICGSPLYDDNSKIQDEADYDTPDYENEDDSRKKRNIIICIIVAAVLVAIIAGVAFAFSSKGNKETESSSETSSSSAVQEITTKKRPQTEKPTKETSTAPTTEKTTESTTAETTTAPAPVSYVISVDIDGNGAVSGDGSYESGTKAQLVATADEGFQFAGWYDNSTGTLVASGEKYTVTVKNNLNLTAKFERMETKAE